MICPACSARLGEGPNSTVSLKCPKCGADYPSIDGVLHFVPHDQYSRSFSYEWHKHAHTLLDGPQRDGTERSLTAVHIGSGDVTGRLVLDAGCGMGRFTDVLTRWGARVVAVDLSEAVHVARRNLAERPGVAFLQADVFKLPFAPASFDAILSWGVLHHTPDCAAAFRALVPLLKPGGLMHIFVYGKSKSMRRRFVEFYRIFTPRLPHPVLYALCWLAVPMYYIYKIPLVGNAMRVLLPMSRQRDARERVLETFDDYSPPHASRHTFPEVHGWFVEAGFTDIRIYDPPIRIVGRKRPA
jgi:SAM-dependent methyltransferase